MGRSNQNIVPYEFAPLYEPILKFKKILMGRNSHLDVNSIIRGLVTIHYSTFILASLYYQINKSIDKIISVRQFAELVTSQDSYMLTMADIASTL